MSSQTVFFSLGFRNRNAGWNVGKSGIPWKS